MTDPTDPDDELVDVDVESLDSDGWVRLEAPRFLPPGLTDVVRGGADGTVTDTGGVALATFDDLRLGVPEDVSWPAGTDVDVTLRNGHLHGRPRAVSEQVEQYEQRRRKLAKRADERARAWRKRKRKAEAEAFWSEYDVPVEVTIGIKGRRSGLLKGSSGTGRAANTVEHLVVQETVDDGRLQRAAESYLCDDSAEFRFTESVTRSGPDGEEYRPPVTCKTCLGLMERWQTDAAAGDTGEDE